MNFVVLRIKFKFVVRYKFPVSRVTEMLGSSILRNHQVCYVKASSSIDGSDRLNNIEAFNLPFSETK